MKMKKFKTVALLLSIFLGMGLAGCDEDSPVTNMTVSFDSAYLDVSRSGTYTVIGHDTSSAMWDITTDPLLSITTDVSDVITIGNGSITRNWFGSVYAQFAYDQAYQSVIAPGPFSGGNISSTGTGILASPYLLLSTGLLGSRSIAAGGSDYYIVTVSNAGAWNIGVRDQNSADPAAGDLDLVQFDAFFTNVQVSSAAPGVMDELIGASPTSGATLYIRVDNPTGATINYEIGFWQ